MPISDLEGKHVAIMGFGTEGRAALRLLHDSLQHSRISVLEENTAFIQQQAELKDAFPEVDFRSGGAAFHALEQYDVIIKSPGISPYRAELKAATASGTQLTSGTQLWCDAHPNERLVIVTGTKGKSTTSSLIAHLLNTSGRRTQLIGNIGTAALEAFSPEEPPEFWVMELSSYQATGLRCNAEVALLLNLFPEHTDWHGSTGQYYRDKTDFLRAPGIRSVIVEREQRNLPSTISTLDKLITYNNPTGMHCIDGGIVERGKTLLDASDSPLPGEHNLLNICAALTTIRQLGITPDEVLPQLHSFKGLPHRLSILGERNGVQYVDDSISTTPESALAALRSFPEKPCTQLLGGYDRDLDWRIFAEASCNSNLNCVITLPGNADRIAAALRRANPDLPVIAATDMEDAVTKAAASTPPGGVIILSPGAPSYGSYRDFRERGNRFARYSGFNIED